MFKITLVIILTIGHYNGAHNKQVNDILVEKQARSNLLPFGNVFIWGKVLWTYQSDYTGTNYLNKWHWYNWMNLFHLRRDFILQ